MDNCSETPETVNLKFPKWVYGIMILVLLTVIIFAFWVALDCRPDWSKFNVLMTLFSGLAFSGMIGAIFLQSQELKIQRQELIATRDVLAETARANEESARIARLQMHLQAMVTDITTETKILEMMHPNNKATPSESDRELLRERVKMIKDFVEPIDKNY